jgi:arsenite methyltransferase
MDHVDKLRASIQSRYQGVSQDPHGKFMYPVGRESLAQLGYEDAWLRDIPTDMLDRFVGVGNPFQIQRPRAGERVLDVGCGCGVDVFVAAHFVGQEGRATGVEMTTEMLERPRRAQASWPHGNLEFVQGLAEDLPFADENFDLVISSGVLNLAPDKDQAYREIFRVLKPGGFLATADLLVMDDLPEEVLKSADAWSS